MLTRIQLKATGRTAHEVEDQMRFAIDVVQRALGLQGSVSDQFIEGTPGEKFDGRLVYTVDSQITGDSTTNAAVPARVSHA